MLAEDTSAPEALGIRHFSNWERYPRADDSENLKVDDKPPRSSRKSSKKSTKSPPEDPAKFVVADPQAKESSRKSSKLKKKEDAHEGKSTNTHRHKKTHKSGPPVVAETINESPIENALDIQSEELSSPAPVIRKRPKKLKPSAEKNDESLPNESFKKSSTKPSSLTLSTTTQRTSKKPKPIPPKPKTPNSTDGYFYAQNTTAAFNSASSSSATNANAFAVNDGNFGGGNVAGIGKPPGM